MRKSDRVKVHHEKERWGESSPCERAMGLEFTIGNSDGVRVHHKKKSDAVRIHHERKSDGVELTMRKSDGVRVHHEKERWGESSARSKER